MESRGEIIISAFRESVLLIDLRIRISAGIFSISHLEDDDSSILSTCLGNFAIHGREYNRMLAEKELVY